MNSRPIGVTVACVIAGAATLSLAAQAPSKRDFAAEYRAAVQAAKDAAQFDWLGTLVRTCLLPQSGGENTSEPGWQSSGSAPG